MSQTYYSPSPLTAYIQAANKSRELIEGITEELKKAISPDRTPEVIHWGHVGDLNEINHKLSNVLQFITNGEKK
jgi:hypothetical protein